jgi:hypothetical protein
VATVHRPGSAAQTDCVLRGIYRADWATCKLYLIPDCLSFVVHVAMDQICGMNDDSDTIFVFYHKKLAVMGSAPSMHNAIKDVELLDCTLFKGMIQFIIPVAILPISLPGWRPDVY